MATDAAAGGLRGRVARALGRLSDPVDIAPLAMFRILFGLMMAAAMVRFWAKGWIRTLYVDPSFHFAYDGFAWVRPPGPVGTHALFLLVGLAAVGIMLGWRYRLSAWTFFLGFTYAELMDKANYLNHYYFVSLVAFLLLWLPAGSAWSLDARRRPRLRRDRVARWQVGALKLQVGLVYFFAGLAKLNADWLFEAQPLSLWLPAKAHLPLIGPLLDLRATAFAFSWAGAAFDLAIAFLLLSPRIFPSAYAAAAVFHLLTAWLFPVIGMFPWVMMCAASVFGPARLHRAALEAMARAALRLSGRSRAAEPAPAAAAPLRPLPWALALFFAFQAAWPLRFLLQPGSLFWTEAGYRFSWRVMLMEKSGHATFFVTDPATGRRAEVMSCDYLTRGQEKMMATQPDMILAFARHLASDYARKGVRDPEVRVHSYVTLNGRGSRLFVDSTLNLAALPRDASPASCLRPYPYGL